jgi:hypothetical protein
MSIFALTRICWRERYQSAIPTALGTRQNAIRPGGDDAKPDLATTKLNRSLIMVAQNDSAAGSGGKSLDDVLEFEGASIRVVERHDIGAVELRIQGETGRPWFVVLAPLQAHEIASRLVTAAIRIVVLAEERS